jgi:5-methyltetrahydrofolate--homocysteine methyltransferase
VSEFRKTTPLPILAQPNAGLPKLVDGQTVFDMSPGEFAKGISACLENGANLVGGCCGTTPAHIRAVADLIAA